MIEYNEHGRRIGETHPLARYSDHEVELVHQLREAGLSYGQIAKKLEMPKATVASIVSGRSRCQQAWKWKEEKHAR